MNAEEGQAMVDASRETGNKLMCGYNYRFSPEVQTLKKFAEAGEFGDMYFARTIAMRRRGIPVGACSSRKKRTVAARSSTSVFTCSIRPCTSWAFPNPSKCSGRPSRNSASAAM